MKSEWYKQTWLWLMGIFAILAITLLIILGLELLSIPFSNKVDGTTIGAYVAAGGVFVAVIQIGINHKRSKMQSTAQAYLIIRKGNKNIDEKLEEYDELEKSGELEKYDEFEEYEKMVKKNPYKRLKKLGSQIENYLDEMDRFFACVCERVYDIKIIQRTSREYLITQFNEYLDGHIKRIKNNYKASYERPDDIYRSFEDAIDYLKKHPPVK